MEDPIPFNKCAVFDDHPRYLTEALTGGHLSAMGPFSLRCESWLNDHNRASNLIVSSASHALEMMALLLEIGPGDEVILPSFTFVSTANAFALRGATLRFADNDRYGNIKVSEVERLLGPKTKAVVAVHYGGHSCDMDQLLKVCSEAKVALCEDAAQAIGANFRGKKLGTFGTFGCYSFHETKNVSAGEGGALILTPPPFHLERAEFLREKGTNRRAYHKGLVDKYTWVDVGSSYLLSELNCAFLYPQLERFDLIQARRSAIWHNYQAALTETVARRGIEILETPAWNESNWHIFALIFDCVEIRDKFIRHMGEAGILCPFHYVPLHSSPYGRRLAGNRVETLPECDRISSRLVRLPVFYNLKEFEQERIISEILRWASLQ